MKQRLWSEVLLVACGSAALLVGCGDDTSVVKSDAAIDSPPSFMDAPSPPAGHYHYVIDKVTVPTNTTQARELGLDLNGDTTVDNQLGMVLATFAGMGFEPQLGFDKQIDTGKDIMLADLYTLDFTSGQASTFTIYQGANPMPAACSNAQDTTCRHHLTGSATFTALATPVDPPLTGNFTSGVLAAGPGHLTVQLVFPDTAPTPITLVGARVKVISASATGVQNAVLAGGVTQTDIDSKLVPAIQVGATAVVARDCTALSNPPSCGCMNSSKGQTYIGLFDVDHNCVISVDEVKNNTLIASLLAPDVLIENQMCVSIGVGAHAVPAGFVAPQ